MSMEGRTEGLVGVVVLILIASLLIASLLPTAIETHNDSSVENASGTVNTLYDLFPVFYVLVPLIAIIGVLMWIFRE